MVNSSGLLVVARKRSLRSASEYSPVLATWIASHGLLRAFSFSAYKTKRARMEGESTTQASTPARAVFLSYASQCGSHAITSVPQRSFQCPYMDPSPLASTPGLGRRRYDCSRISGL